MRHEVGTCLGTVHAGRAEAHIWAARVGEHVPRLDGYSRELLSVEERQRLVRYRSRESAERYVVTRSLVRVVLGDRLGIAPSRVNVRHTDRGKPILSDTLHFNVSHSGDLILLAVSGGHAVGVDIERRRTVDRVEALADRWLTDDERAAVARLARNGLALSEAFLRVWSLKEARLKALGVGIAGAAGARLDQVDAVPLDEVLEPLGETAAGGFVGAVAFTGPPNR